MKNINFVMNFQDPCTIFCYHLISVHHEVFWYIIIILSLVYWSMYTIIRDYSWHTFSRAVGFFRFLRGFIFLVRIAIFFCYILFFLNIMFQGFAHYLVKFLDWIHGIDKEMRKYVFVKGADCYDIIDDDLVSKDNAYITFIIRTNYVFPEFLYSVTFADFKRLYLNFVFNLNIISPEPKGYSVYIRDDWYMGEDEFLNLEKFRHSTILEYVYAAFPTLIIIYILVPSLFLLYSLDEDLDPKFTVKVIGHQWYWTYEYEITVRETSGKFVANNRSFDSVLIQEGELDWGGKRLLEVDKRLFLPIGVTLRFLITSTDVLHSWSVPEMGIKVDAVPGRLNQFLTLICRPGVFVGQCSELCGVAHGFMPVVIQCVPFDIFLEYLTRSGPKRPVAKFTLDLNTQNYIEKLIASKRSVAKFTLDLNTQNYMDKLLAPKKFILNRDTRNYIDNLLTPDFDPKKFILNRDTRNYMDKLLVKNSEFLTMAGIAAADSADLNKEILNPTSEQYLQDFAKRLKKSACFDIK